VPVARNPMVVCRFFVIPQQTGKSQDAGPGWFWNGPYEEINSLLKNIFHQ
jgi:hypothetical protein